MAEHEITGIDQRLFDAASNGDAATLGALLDAHPEKLDLRDEPHGMTLLHRATRHLPVVDLLLDRGLDVNVRDVGDNTTAMHWAAAGGELDVVRRLADVGGDVVGHGDDHALEVIGWATCWDGCDDDVHRAVADFLISRGAQHHIFSAIALDLPDEVRRIVAADPGTLNQRMSRNEANQLPLHFATRMKRPAMVELLVALGADPLGVDSSGNSVALYATSPEIDRPAMRKVLTLLRAELESATRGGRAADVSALDLVAALSLSEWEIAERAVRDNPALINDAHSGVLHMTSKRGDAFAVEWLLTNDADPNARWMHYDSSVTPLHLAILGDHEAVVRQLLLASADTTIRDSKHDADALGWATFFERTAMLRLLER